MTASGNDDELRQDDAGDDLVGQLAALFGGFADLDQHPLGFGHLGSAR
jgi:hypothetical protein